MVVVGRARAVLAVLETKTTGIWQSEARNGPAWVQGGMVATAIRHVPKAQAKEDDSETASK